MPKENATIVKEKRKTSKTRDVIYIRAPANYRKDLDEIAELTGLTINAICLELLRPAIKAKLKALKETT